MTEEARPSRVERAIDRLDRIAESVWRLRTAVVVGPDGPVLPEVGPSLRELSADADRQLADEDDARRIEVAVSISCPADRALHGRRMGVWVLTDDGCALDLAEHGVRNVRLLDRHDKDSGLRILRVESGALRSPGRCSRLPAARLALQFSSLAHEGTDAQPSGPAGGQARN